MISPRLLTSVALFAGCMAAHAQSPSTGNASDRVVARRATEAVIWGMPAVNTELMRQAMLRSTSAKENEVVYWSKPVNWKNQTLTPNPDSIYFMTFVNTKESGPLVIDIPPADNGSLAVNIVTTWQMPLEDAGPEGADKGKGGKYLILPPDYKDTPPEGYIVLRSDTYGGFALMRSNLASHGDADIAKSVEYGKRIQVYPLSQASAPPPTRFTDAYDILFDSTIRYDASFFSTLNDVVQKEPWIQRDRVMIDQLKSLGIEKGKPYQPDPRMAKTLNAAAREAHAEMSARYDAGFYRMVPEYRWFPAAMPEVIRAVSTGYANVDEYPVDARGVTYTLGFTGIKRLGTAQFYLMVNKDREGKPLDGARTYRLVVPPNVPVKQYWSATAYDRDTHALIRNMPRASLASTTTGIQKNADGAVEVYFGPKAPRGKEANWVPTDPKRQFELLFRLYGPEKPFFDKAWKLPDVERVQ
ncbi:MULTISPECIES: DUF1254 domain-containing protein [unclassified Cupriavidus]|uniref:DUF1254 domain-containing protein n=1 Tax=unclassified Cupriavidus TaxID=2640874 RepID=UPI001C0066E5|nr:MULTISPECIES: DUF1254 domain-containing protein [unclassified Cupriavidus]MCA3185289.1 DUF1254 domain-containing protein [Cupriavidus sp.]MCA3190135.1 DUF1254 domain-containing protein [Cupriavidus sp.]MCA3197586.1 DUF1254 domain-containing protein [Cupriavidus sp.]MCA3201925.1 DUF1254 domain-containing protein [Cupriavidus sp.]MCA3208043.1 DUF1254 domain-containing protein [Cupriavidus sp.]